MKQYVNYIDASIGKFNIENISTHSNVITISNNKEAVSFLIKPNKLAVVIYFTSIINGDECIEKRIGMDYSVFKEEVMEMLNYRIETENKQEWKILKNELEEILD